MRHATQIVVEQLGLNRPQRGRANFVACVWEWKQQSGSTIMQISFHCDILPCLCCCLSRTIESS